VNKDIAINNPKKVNKHEFERIEMAKKEITNEKKTIKLNKQKLEQTEMSKKDVLKMPKIKRIKLPSFFE
jgi:hypothetical protein